MAIDSLDDVRVFRQIVASGSVSSAARVLRQSKNRVSQRLAALERSVGARLAERTTRTFQLTEEGRRFFDETTALVDAAARAERAVAKREALAGSVRVGLRSALVGAGIGEGLVRLLASAPELSMQIVVMDDGASVLHRGLDFAVGVGRPPDSGLVARKLGEARYAMAAVSSYLSRAGVPSSPDELAAHECIRVLGERTEATWTLTAGDGRRVAARVGGRLECSDARMQRELVQSGMGIGLFPIVDIDRDPGLERVLPGWTLAPIGVWAVGPRSRLELTRVREVLAVVRRAVERLSR